MHNELAHVRLATYRLADVCESSVGTQHKVWEWKEASGVWRCRCGAFSLMGARVLTRSGPRRARRWPTPTPHTTQKITEVGVDRNFVCEHGSGGEAVAVAPASPACVESACIFCWVMGARRRDTPTN